MKTAWIKAIASYLPENILSNEDLVKEFPEWTVDKIGGKVGINSRHIASDCEKVSDMAIKAAEALFAQHPEIQRSSIDFVLLCTQSPDYPLPSTSCIIQDRLGLPTKCGALDFNLGCSGYEYGLALAKSLIVSGIANNVLLLTAEQYTKYLDKQDKGNRTIFGDGASATVISTDGIGRIGEFVLGTDGSGYDKLIKKEGEGLFMDGPAIFEFSSGVVPDMIDDTLKANGIAMEDVSMFVFHQANKYMINYLRKLIGIEKERFYVDMEEVGNTVSSTVPIALESALSKNLIHGKTVLAGFGVGLSWGATVIDFV